MSLKLKKITNINLIKKQIKRKRVNFILDFLVNNFQTKLNYGQFASFLFMKRLFLILARTCMTFRMLLGCYTRQQYMFM